MKKRLVKLLFLIIFIASGSFSASAQIYVKIRPTFPVVVQTPQPSKDHVWIDEEWEHGDGNYRYSGGHWAAPPHPGYRWNNGHWKRHHREGDEWIHGSWRK